MLTITESGLDHLPVEPRAKTFASHEPGWTAQTNLI
jgi:hypothetical protein